MELLEGDLDLRGFSERVFEFYYWLNYQSARFLSVDYPGAGFES